MVVCIPSLKPSRICKYGKLSQAFLTHVGDATCVNFRSYPTFLSKWLHVSSRLLKHLDMLRGLMLFTVNERVSVSWNSAEASRQCCLCSLSSAALPVVQVA